MFSTKKAIFLVVAAVGMLVIGATVRTSTMAAQTANAAAPAATPQSTKVVAGEVEAKKLLLLMDSDKNGKVSRAEFMAFMAAEFDRLDTNHNGELDVKELEQSQLMTVHHGGGHR
jgi:EF hand domain-containing protein